MTGRSPLRGSGLRPFGAEPQDASQAKPPVPNAEDEALPDITTKPPEQIAEYMASLVRLIAIYSGNVATAEERYRDAMAKEREFLASMMAEYTRLCHFVVRGAATALEQSERTGA